MKFMRTLWKRQFIRRLVGILAIVTVIIIAILLIIFLGYPADWTGFNRHVESVPSGQQVQPAKLLWDWMQLLIIPIVLAVGALAFNSVTSKTEQKIALDKQRADLLQIYLDRMTELLLKENLLKSEPDSEVRTVARVRTLTVLGQLDTTRQNAVLSFLREAALVTSEPGKSIVSLSKAQMSDADLRGVDFSCVDLSQANLKRADLRGANFNEANLSGAFFNEANLSGVHLIEANLAYVDFTNADLSDAQLSDANLGLATLRHANLSRASFISVDLKEADLRNANLSHASLIKADLCRADLSHANLTKAYLREANLFDAKLNESVGVTQEQLSEAKAIDSYPPFRL